MSKKEVSKLFPLLLGPFFLVLGLLLNRGDVLPHEVYGLQRYVGTACIFLAWIHSLLCWGKLISVKWKNVFGEGSLSVLLVGTIFYILLGGLFGTIGLIGYGSNFLYLIFTLFSPLMMILVNQKERYFSYNDSFNSVKKWILDRSLVDWALIISLVLVHLLVLTQCFYINLIRDVYNYHLGAPRAWWSAGEIYFIKEIPLSLHAAYWEYLHFWAFGLLSFSPGKGLISVQIFAQLVHFTLGFLATTIAGFSLLRKFSLSFSWKSLAVLAGICNFWLLWISWYAKNDWGLIFIILGALTLVMEHKKTNFQAHLFIGLLLGVAFGIKFSAAYPMALVVLVFLLQESNTKLQSSKEVNLCLLSMMGMSVVAALPILIRNYIYTKNPFFPLFNNIFPSDVLPLTWMAMAREFEMGKIENFIFFFKSVIVSFLQYDPFLVVIILPILFRAFKIVSRNTYALALATFLGLVLFILRGGVAIMAFVHFRLAGTLLFLSGMISIVCFAEISATESLGRLRRVMIYLPLIVAFLLLGRPFLPWSHMKALLVHPDPSTVIAKGYDYGGCRKWMTENLPTNETIYSMGYGLIYFFYRHNVSVIPFDPALDNILFKHRDPKTILKTLKEKKVKYLFTHLGSNGEHMTLYSKRVLPYLLKWTNSLILKGPRCYLFDLSKIEY